MSCQHSSFASDYAVVLLKSLVNIQINKIKESATSRVTHGNWILLFDSEHTPVFFVLFQLVVGCFV